MNTEMVLVGIILFSGMIAASVKLWLNKRKQQESDYLDSDTNDDYDTCYDSYLKYCKVN